MWFFTWVFPDVKPHINPGALYTMNAHEPIDVLLRHHPPWTRHWSELWQCSCEPNKFCCRLFPPCVTLRIWSMNRFRHSPTQNAPAGRLREATSKSWCLDPPLRQRLSGLSRWWQNSCRFGDFLWTQLVCLGAYHFSQARVSLNVVLCHVWPPSGRLGPAVSSVYYSQWTHDWTIKMHGNYR